MIELIFDMRIYFFGIRMEDNGEKQTEENCGNQ